MDRRETSGYNCDGGFNELIDEDDLSERSNVPDLCSNHSWRKVSIPNVTPGRVSTVSVALLAAVLLIVDISLGVHYKQLTDTHLTTEDIKRINGEMTSLQDSYKNAIDSMKSSQKQLDSEMSRQTQTNWELEHQKKRQTDYEVQIDKLTNSIALLRKHIIMINDGCRHCPQRWILMNSMCYYLPFSDNAGLKTWQKAREFCQIYGGDLAVIDSKDKENSTVRLLINNGASQTLKGFWIGLRYLQEYRTWKWLDRTELLEAYWNDGEPDGNNEDCAAVYARENFFKAWDDVKCAAKMKWICEKAPTYMS